MRTLLSLTGADPADFLQGLVTNDLDKLAGDGILYAALLTPQGKLVADFFLVARGEELLIDVDESLAPALFQRLTMYKLRRKITIAESPLKVFCGTGTPPEGALPDPRHPALGWRLYGDKAGDDGTDWAALRVAHLVPETGVELTPETYILEAGFERLHGVDFRKGCYVGQEVTARMKHKTELRKGLARVAVEGDAAPGTEITSDGRPVGQLHTVAGGEGIAYLRFDRAEGGMQAGEARLRLIPGS
ncbi:folate-binding protein YgfZ [Pseudoroseicyclus sp. CXY001]|uniref:CAF17-like 4Fe-4S cluster assembly/insertion protein YgfZ n=1 Tax=Pseudoroseicyclus sp. CXY001 TaxID=3242492 RepID=UPI0035715262